LYALLSSLSGQPFKQGIAVTGSVNQRGEVQPIGGANEKIEGFFRICQGRGLTGEQGVMIPASNVLELMLHEDVVKAAAAGQFHIWPIRTIDEGIEQLTGVPAGERDADGAYPEGSIHHAVQRRLTELAEELKSFGESDD
jgi:predicted ATP-dependent protease